jgi:uroporphyrinogen decarboxylase
MTNPAAWQGFLTAARGGTPERVPTALIVDSPWMPGFAGMSTLDFFLYPDEWLETHMKVLERFPDVVFIRIYHNDTPCSHLLSRIGLLPFEVWNFSHEMDIGAVREAVGPALALLGNVAPLDTLARGTPEQVLEEARACVEKAAPQGAFVLSAAGGASPGTPAENIDAMARAAMEWGTQA